MIDRLQAVDLDLLRLRSGERVLDMGSGTGRHVLQASLRRCQVVGLDSDFDSLRLAGNYVNLIDSWGVVQAGVTLMMGWGDRLPFRDGAFDRVICTEVLEHIPDDMPTIREIMRVLRPGGTIAFSVPDQLAEALLWRMSWQYRNTPGGHVRIYGRLQLAKRLKSAGLRLYAVRWRHSMETLYWVARIGPRDRWDSMGWVKSLRRFLDSPRTRDSRLFHYLEETTNYLFPKSIVFYGRKPVSVEKVQEAPVGASSSRRLDAGSPSPVAPGSG
jgi:SAM-dependent methyltransferase